MQDVAMASQNRKMNALIFPKLHFPHCLVLSTLIPPKKAKMISFLYRKLYLVLALVLVTTPLFVPGGFIRCNLLLEELRCATFTSNPYEEKSGKRLNKTKTQLAIKIRKNHKERKEGLKNTVNINKSTDGQN